MEYGTCSFKEVLKPGRKSFPEPLCTVGIVEPDTLLAGKHLHIVAVPAGDYSKSSCTRWLGPLSFPLLARLECSGY